MSRTKRTEDPYYNESKTLPKKKKWKATRDKKHWGKPNKAFKQMRRQGEKAKIKNAIRDAVANDKDFDNVVIPDAKKHDVWDWN
jgi:predicted transcriptional regulator